MENILRGLEIPEVERVIEKFANENVTLESALRLTSEKLQDYGILMVRDQYRLKARIQRHLQENRHDATRPTTSRSTPQGVAAEMGNLFRSRFQGGGQASSRKRKGHALTGAVSHIKVVCLAERDMDKRPNSKEKETLMLAGLGEKRIQVSRDSSAQELQELIIGAFPKLRQAGGFQYLRNPANSTLLVDIVPSAEGYTAAHLKNLIGTSRIFIRPIQVDLDVTPEQAVEIEPQHEILESCFTCHEMVPVNKMKQHIDEHNNNNLDLCRRETNPSSTVQLATTTPSRGSSLPERCGSASAAVSDNSDSDLIDPQINRHVNDTPSTSTSSRRMNRDLTRPQMHSRNNDIPSTSSRIDRCKAEIESFQKGMNDVAGFWSLVESDPLKSLLVSSNNSLTFNSVKRLFKIRYSESEALRDQEQDTVFRWEQFLQMSGDIGCELDTEDGKFTVRLHDILRFCTGADEAPPNGFEKQIDVNFFTPDVGTKPYPTASTCGLQLCLPRGVSTKEEFCKMFSEAIVCSPGFGKQ